MKKLYGLIMILSLLILNFSCRSPERKFINYQVSDQQLEVYTDDGQYIIRPYSENILETAFIPKGEQLDNHSWSVVMHPEKVNMRFDETDSIISYFSDGIGVRITKFPFHIAYFYGQHDLISEKGGYLKSRKSNKIEFNLTSDEVLYGGGTRVLGMNRRGNRLELYNKAHYGYTTHSELMNYSIPMVLSSEKYAIHFDNAPIGYLDLDSQDDNTLNYETIGGRMVYQVVAGDSWAEILDAYTDLTGKQPLPPRWTFGNFSSRFGYHSEAETRMTVNKFLEDSIPLDAVVIDIYWFGPDIFGYMGNLEFWSDSFPTPDRMISDFRKQGVKTVLVTEPFILTTSNRWQEAVNNEILGTNSDGNPYTYDFYFGNTGLIDIYKPEARNWFWNIYKSFTERGVAGWWGDLGEPEVHPSALQHSIGSADELHNVYGHEWAKMIFEGYEKDFSDQRPFILMRSGAAGSQHYGMIPWTGDVSRSWGGLKPQNELSLQMGMQGLAYMHSDLGGFAEGVTFDSELYTRWLQYGVFQPLFRPHAQEHIAAEPVFHDDHTKALAKQAIELRYFLLPYTYTLAFENTQNGMPFMRPIFFEEPDNEKLLTYDESYLWGNEFLVSPVVDSNAISQTVYFPKGNNWFDFYSNKKYAGGSHKKIELHADYIPVFVRGGAIIPMIDPIMNTDQYSTKKLNLHYYYDPEVKESSGYVYDDDGKTPYAYEKEMYELISFKSCIKEDGVKLQLNSEIGKYWTAGKRQIILIIHNFEQKPKIVKSGKLELPFNFDKKLKRLKLTIEWNPETEKNIEVIF